MVLPAATGSDGAAPGPTSRTEAAVEGGVADDTAPPLALPPAQSSRVDEGAGSAEHAPLDDSPAAEVHAASNVPYASGRAVSPMERTVTVVDLLAENCGALNDLIQALASEVSLADGIMVQESVHNALQPLMYHVAVLEGLAVKSLMALDARNQQLASAWRLLREVQRHNIALQKSALQRPASSHTGPPVSAGPVPAASPSSPTTAVSAVTLGVSRKGRPVRELALDQLTSSHSQQRESQLRGGMEKPRGRSLVGRRSASASSPVRARELQVFASTFHPVSSMGGEPHLPRGRDRLSSDPARVPRAASAGGRVTLMASMKASPVARRGLLPGQPLGSGVSLANGATGSRPLLTTVGSTRALSKAATASQRRPARVRPSIDSSRSATRDEDPLDGYAIIRRKPLNLSMGKKAVGM